MPAFTENYAHLQAANNLRLAIMELSKLGLTIKRFQHKNETIIEIDHNTLLTPDSSSEDWHKATVNNCRVIWQLGEVK